MATDEHELTRIRESGFSFPIRVHSYAFVANKGS
jgi:hypothetical protein